jgi:uncharacterized protein (DUF1810 family)
MNPYPLARFKDAQEGVFDAVRAELQAGRKRGHWMWFMFPQMRGLGMSEMSQFYGLGSLTEAEAYLADPVLGPRLIELSEIVLSHGEHTAREIFGAPDDMKLRSCATLFSAAPDAPLAFARLIDQFFGGIADAKTLGLIGRGG